MQPRRGRHAIDGQQVQREGDRHASGHVERVGAGGRREQRGDAHRRQQRQPGRCQRCAPHVATAATTRVAASHAASTASDHAFRDW